MGRIARPAGSGRGAVVGSGGFEPPEALANRFTDRQEPLWNWQFSYGETISGGTPRYSGIEVEGHKIGHTAEEGDSGASPPPEPEEEPRA